MSDELLRSNPSITAYKSPSVTLRQELADEEVPSTTGAAKQASDITHLVFCASSTGCLPGADWELVQLLGLPPATKRVMLSPSKDLAENNPGARVLVVCSKVIPLSLRGPSESHVGQAIFGDAAGAVVVGSDPDPGAGERGVFELVWTSQEIVPGTRDGWCSPCTGTCRSTCPAPDVNGEVF
ncbi:Chalcone synthase 2 [Dichanthelium oligosanthes]|uniref:Chalcone synthase 2 n=1 Tax=Dichanthelium oligosanthes TaxID=888268 RepID=A0A1E5UMI0_9POAL|nr:Chalcone synthase 2 [Dichanthelium oligosanthes]